MNKSIINLFKRHPDYLALTVATFLSGLGTTLSAVAIFHELARMNADSFLYSIAFALTILPGLISSHWGSRGLAVDKLMILLEICSSFIILLSWAGSFFNHIPLLLTALPLASISYGILVPFINTYTRERFEDSELLAVAEVANLILVLDFILGSFLGILLIEKIGIHRYFLFDILTYWVAALVIYWLSKRYPEPFRRTESKLDGASIFSWKNLSLEQRRAFLLYPTLVAACAPCTAILPGAAKSFGDFVNWGSLVISTPLVLLMFKTQGQFFGPLFVRALNLDSFKRLRTLCLFCLGAFLVCYAIAFQSPSLIIATMFVFLAHIFSNVVFTVAYIEFKKVFSSESIGAAATKQYQVGAIIIVVTSLAGGYFVGNFGNLFSVGFGGLGLLIALILFKK